MTVLFKDGVITIKAGTQILSYDTGADPMELPVDIVIKKAGEFNSIEMYGQIIDSEPQDDTYIDDIRYLVGGAVYDSRSEDSSSDIEIYHYGFDYDYATIEVYIGGNFKPSDWDYKYVIAGGVVYNEGSPTKMSLSSDAWGFDVTDNTISNMTLNNTNYWLEDSLARTQIDTKQNSLVSGVNIKTINNESLLNGGNIEIKSGIQVTYNETKHRMIFGE